MKKLNLAQRLLLVSLVCGGLCAVGRAQPAGNGSLYKITSGIYRIVGGFGGELRQRLPNPDQTYVALNPASPGGGAELTFLEADGRTVHLRLTKGTVTGSEVRFSFPMDYPIYPDLVRRAMVDYVVTSLAHQLTIQGAIRVIDPPCCDIPNYFAHTNVVAVAFPEVAVRVSELELCWAAASKVSYQVQSSTDLTAPEWTNVGLPVAGSEGTLCVTVKLVTGQPHQYYRVIPAGSGAPPGSP